MISTRFIDYIILNSKMQLEVTEGQKVASNSKNKIKIRKCTYICHFLWRSNFKFRKCTISYDSQKDYQTKLWMKFFFDFVLLFRQWRFTFFEDNLGIFWDPNGILADGMRSSASFLSHYTLIECLRKAPNIFCTWNAKVLWRL